MGDDSKYVWVGIIILYLFMASYISAETFSTVAWNPGIDFDIITHDVNFSEEFNLTATDIEILKGEWVIENGNLTSKAPINWFIIKDEIAISKGYPITKEYKVYGMTDKTRFTIFYGARAYLVNWLDVRHTFWEFDISNGTLNCKGTKNSLLGEKEDIYYSSIYDFSDVSDCTLKTFIDKPWGIAKTHVISYVYIDGVKVATAEWEEWMALESLSATGGVYTEQAGLKINQIEGFKRVEESDPGALGTMSILLRVMLFKPPSDAEGIPIMPLWLNFIGFKIPLVMLGVIIYGLARSG